MTHPEQGLGVLGGDINPEQLKSRAESLFGPDTADEQRFMRGAVTADRSTFIMTEVEDMLDKRTAIVLTKVIKRAGEGPLDAHFALATWYEWLAINNLRADLKKPPRDAAFSQRR